MPSIVFEHAFLVHLKSAIQTSSKYLGSLVDPAFKSFKPSPGKILMNLAAEFLDDMSFI